MLNLVIAGNPVAVDVAPNTEIDIAGVGHLVLNEQVKASGAATSARCT